MVKQRISGSDIIQLIQQRPLIYLIYLKCISPRSNFRYSNRILSTTAAVCSAIFILKIWTNYTQPPTIYFTLPSMSKNRNSPVGSTPFFLLYSISLVSFPSSSYFCSFCSAAANAPTSGASALSAGLDVAMWARTYLRSSAASSWVGNPFSENASP